MNAVESVLITHIGSDIMSIYSKVYQLLTHWLGLMRFGTMFFFKSTVENLTSDCTIMYLSL